MAQSRGTRHGKCLHRSIGSTEHEQTNFPLEPLETLGAVTNPLAAPFTVSVCFLMHTDRLVWKGLSHYSVVIVSECCSPLGVARLPFAPSGLFSVFKTCQISSDRKQRHEALLTGQKAIYFTFIQQDFTLYSEHNGEFGWFRLLEAWMWYSLHVVAVLTLYI